VTPRPHVLNDCWCGVDHAVSPEVVGEQIDELLASGWHPASKPDDAQVREWSRTMRLLVEDGVTYVEAAAVIDWLERANQHRLAKLLREDVDRVVREGIEAESRG